jgi:urea transport system permease protein
MLVLAFVVMAGGARAQSLDELIAGLKADSFEGKIDAIEALAATGDERAAPVLDAMLNRRLLVQKSTGAVVLGERTGRVYHLTDPISGADLGEAPRGDIETVNVNNRLRGVLRGALGSLTLANRDPNQRAAAADALFKAGDDTMLTPLKQAIERETDNSTRRRIERAQAAVIVRTQSAPDTVLAAIDTLAGHADPEVQSLLASVAADTDDPRIAEAAGQARERVEGRLALWSAVGNIFHGLSLGSVLLLAAVGLAITFGVMGVINMAHGEMVMLGAYTTFVVQEIFRTYVPGAFDVSVIVAIPAAFLVAGLVGIAIERTVIRFLYGRPLETLLATWGLSLVLQQAVRSLFGPTNREVGSPSWMSGAFDIGGGVAITYNRLWIILFSLAVFATLMLLIRCSRFGLQMRAVVQNRPMAASMGIRTGRVDALTFGLGSGIAGMAGVAVSQIDNVSPNLGQGYIIDSFMVVVFGGVGNLWGTLVGALSLGMINKLLEPYSGAVLGKILVLVLIILFIQKRPRGLFALKGRAVEG